MPALIDTLLHELMTAKTRIRDEKFTSSQASRG